MRPKLEHIGSDWTGELRAVVGSIGRLPRGLNMPEQITESLSYSLDDPDHSAFEQLPEWIQNQIKQSAEWQHNLGGGELPRVESRVTTEGERYATDYDDIPF